MPRQARWTTQAVDGEVRGLRSRQPEMQTVDRSYGVSTSTVRDLGGWGNLNLLIEGKWPARAPGLPASRHSRASRRPSGRATTPYRAGSFRGDAGTHPAREAVCRGRLERCGGGAVRPVRQPDDLLRAALSQAAHLAHLHHSLFGLDLGESQAPSRSRTT